MTTVSQHTRRNLGATPIRAAVTHRGKELLATDTAATARLLFENPSVQVLPVLDGARYLGAVERGTLADDLADDAPVGPLAAPLLPTVTSLTPTDTALAALDAHGSTRLVVLDGDHTTYLGIVCLRGDRERLCVDAECHADHPHPSQRKDPR